MADNDRPREPIRSSDDDAETQTPLGTGRSGPHDIGTHPHDVPPTLGTDLGGSDSPTNRLWRQIGAEVPESHHPPPPSEVDLPTPPDNPGGPPPRS